MTIRVASLVPGDRLRMPGGHEGIFMFKLDHHPIYPALALVVWYLVIEKRYSFDALRINQELPGEIITGPLGHRANEVNLREAFFSGAQL